MVRCFDPNNEFKNSSQSMLQYGSDMQSIATSMIAEKNTAQPSF